MEILNRSNLKSTITYGLALILYICNIAINHWGSKNYFNLSLSLYEPLLMASSKEDNQASFGTKRTWNDVDWTFTSCGNLKISFRVVYHRRYCDASRPYVISLFKIMSSYKNNHHRRHNRVWLFQYGLITWVDRVTYDFEAIQMSSTENNSKKKT